MQMVLPATLMYVEPKHPDGLTDFKIYAYPFKSITLKDLFSKSGSGNVDKYKLKTQLMGFNITKYKTEYREGKKISVPVYGPAHRIGGSTTFNIVTNPNLAAQKSAVGGPGDLLKNLGR